MYFAKIDNDHYRSLPLISNSDISIFLNELTGQVQKPAHRAFAIGSYFHAYVLEGMTLAPHGLSISDVSMVERMAERLSRHEAASLLQQVRHHEMVRLFVDEQSGLPCKAKLDAVAEDFVIDLKTTAAASLREFEQAILKYGYDRQAAHYLLASGKREYYMVGVQKAAPYNVYLVSMSKEAIEMGHAKRAALLQRWKQERRPLPGHMAGRLFLPNGVVLSNDAAADMVPYLKTLCHSQNEFARETGELVLAQTTYYRHLNHSLAQA